MYRTAPWITAATAVACVASMCNAQAGFGTAFMYQGVVTSAGAPVNGQADFQFSLWSAAQGGSQAGSTVAINAQTVVDGLIAVQLDFGLSAWSGQARWLQVAVRTSGGGAFETLPRQFISPTPYAIRASGLSGAQSVGIGIDNPGFPLTFASTTGPKISLWGNSGNHFGFGIQNNLMQMYTATNSSDIAFGFGSSAALTETMRIRGNGNVGIGTATPTNRFHVRGEGDVMALEGTTHAFIEYFPTAAAGGRKAYVGFPQGGSVDFVLANEFTSGEIALMAARVGIGTMTPTAKLDVAGVCRVDTLEIDAGADVAENFDIAPAGDVAPIPGMVVRIDPNAEGKLAVSSSAYDKRVAGIISGAGDVRPGMILGQPGTIADGAMPVASVGRVWCYVDADAGGAVEAGDLLTTSTTPGHAMKAADAARAPGCVIGKAMTSIKQGKGLVLVLVSLQ